MLRFIKGYADDAGTDIILDEPVYFAPHKTTVVNLHVQIIPAVGTMSFLCARTSAARDGLIVATCPIDPNYEGDVHAIVHNVSDNAVIYNSGDSFCQYVTVKIEVNTDAAVKKPGTRTNSAFGGTDK